MKKVLGKSKLALINQQIVLKFLKRNKIYKKQSIFIKNNYKVLKKNMQNLLM
jgi:hypothetical protein